MNKFLLIGATLILGLGAGYAAGYQFKAADTEFRVGMSQKMDGVHRLEAEKAIRETLSRQTAAWNSGSIDAFMADYLKSDALRFASGGKVRRGWQEAIDGYKARYSTNAKMGKLSFTDLEIDVFSESDALVFGRWRLTRENDSPNGLFTLHMRKGEKGWVIASDHTSSAD